MTSPNNRPEQDAPRARRWGLGFSPASTPVLDQLLQAGLIDSQAGTNDQIAAGDYAVTVPAVRGKEISRPLSEIVDEIRSLAISQRLLGTKEIILIHHTDCGMLTFTDDGFKEAIADETGVKPEWAAEAFDDVEEDVRRSIRRITTSPFIPHRDQVRGFVFDVTTGLLREVK